MPELPEVETIVRSLQPVIVGRRVTRLELRWPRQAQPDPPTLTEGVVGRTVIRLDRRGKLLVADLDDGSVCLVHLRMSGRFAWAEGATAQTPEPAHVRVVWWLEHRTGRHSKPRASLGVAGAVAAPETVVPPYREGRVDGASGGQRRAGRRYDCLIGAPEGLGRLMLCDARKFARVRWAPDRAAALAHLGPEPLGARFSGAALAEGLRARRRQLKPLLLDQRFVAGLGNIYTDESLHRAGLHPQRRSDSVSRAAAGRLHRAIQAVLREGIAHCGTSLDWIYPGGSMQDYLRVYGRTGQPCPACGASIVRIVVAQRSTHLCPDCQRRPDTTRPGRGADSGGRP